MLTLNEVGVISESDVQSLKDAMVNDGLVPEYIYESGRQALMLKIKGIEGGLLRLEQDQKTDPVEHPMAIKPLVRKRYKAGGEDYVVSVVPLVEEAAHATHEDFLRTYAAFRKDGIAANFLDVDTSQLSYLKGPDGKRLSYPDGKPIAFFHDVNSSAKDKATITAGFGGFAKKVSDTIVNLEAMLNNYDPASELQQSKIAIARKHSEQSAQHPDDKDFIRYLLQLYKGAENIQAQDISAASQQSAALNRLRNELAELPLADDIKQQIAQRAAWEAPTAQESAVLTPVAPVRSQGIA